MSERGADRDRIRPARRWSEEAELPGRAASLDDEIRWVATFGPTRRATKIRLLGRRWLPLVLALTTLGASAAAAIRVDLEISQQPRGADVSLLETGDALPAASDASSQVDYAPTFDDHKPEPQKLEASRPRWRPRVVAAQPRRHRTAVRIAAAPVVVPSNVDHSRERASSQQGASTRERAREDKNEGSSPRKSPPPPPPEPTAPLIHLYKKKTDTHFFTISDEVRERRLKKGWTFVHLEGDCYTEELPGSVALFQDEGIVCFALDEKTEVTRRALRRLVDAEGDVVFTTDFDAETWSGSWTSEGIAGYVG